ncbi:uncharacterized protein EV154DRAFT_448062 [Mucor mucedo]|uniref:uncharacterized protein n=1 Tax=Mucor mucedo TaxID=29922 RepID=UPI00221FB6B0|nr:uncharacterized protein EV154DRAFT_448062 [Mucor mucedo]KAI7888350.1 hypothetical protein EV154DRAFT_448062 [Mucor mucedo]
MNTRLISDLNKINPKFEGYKLSPFNKGLHRTDLIQENIQVHKDANDHRMGFRDLQARIRHSHLIYGFPLDHTRGSAFCIDQDFNLFMIVYNKITKQTKFHSITELIKPLPVPAFTEPSDIVPIEPQLPSVIALSTELVLASNGVGDIELIGLEEKDGAMLGTSLASVCYLGTGKEGITPVPCVLLTARQVKDKIIMVVYSHTATKKTEFNIATLEMNIPTPETERLSDGSFVLMLKTLHIQQGAEVPVYCAITPSGKRCILGSETKYVKEGYEEVADENKMQVDDPYKWNQDGSDITIVFELPSETPKSSINCKFLVDHLSLLVKSGDELLVSYPYRKLWSTIRPDECLWTFESGLLTLFITKMDENTRWPQLFDHDDGVLENLSQDALSEIKSKLERLTASEGAMTSTSQPAQHPASTDMDEEIDESGQPIIFTVYDTEGTIVDEFHSGTYNWICKSYDKTKRLPSICLQMDVDGLVFSFTETVDHRIEIKHEATFDAFAFVQASKRDGRFTLHDPNFNFTSIIESSRNAYIYFHHDDKRKIEVQTLIDLTQGNDVDVIGAQLLLDDTLMILTETQVIVIELIE